MAKQRLDQALVSIGLLATRSQAESYIKLGHVTVNRQVVRKPGQLVTDSDVLKLTTKEQYVSRAGLKLASVTKTLGLYFKDKVVLDVGSSTGGFTDYALQHGAAKVIAVEVGKDQLHPSLRGNPRIELHEQTDIKTITELSTPADIVLIDVSFISLRDILPYITKLVQPQAQIVAMVKPQFEASGSGVKHKGIIKNDRIRREILKDFEAWAQKLFITADKADSSVTGAKGNLERFYLLKVVN
ncbi:MAG: putative rRNA methyltransferase YqxC [Candidatus Saccharibacteria bacterium]|nr:putative rRNA methyltransferase YqxC [Candidatus Saccharibacteria bacterium]